MDLGIGGRDRRAIFSAIRDDWRTPRELFNGLDAEFHFTCDVASSDDNHLCDRYFTKELDGLTQPWSGVCWLNPPYGPAIYKWLQKAVNESKLGTITVCLLPARTDTIWFHGLVLPFATDIRFIRRRLCYDGDKTKRAPFPSMIVVFRP